MRFTFMLLLCPAVLLCACGKEDDAGDRYHPVNCPVQPYTFYEEGATVFLPTAFTPNGDGRNDLFGLSTWNNTDTSDYRLSVLSGMGAVAFQTTSLNTRWDGKMPDGSDAPAGKYTVLLHYKTFPGPIRDTTLCVRLFQYNKNGCLDTGGETVFFEDQFDMATSAPLYYTTETICP